ncbi:hypothetical protein PIGHUM_01666 [Pigmentiphaga humi]|uniref:3-deoxy-D-arabino-heptulosonate 7-phosphate synthase n=2 Tax=Pigmentiphaga humi TaxID=2478468 RepID=A0A3P4AZX0_9BURK|nr:hypothetical protein PIGHUM_01666 [Pigmentiphaga humi]
MALLDTVLRAAARRYRLPAGGIDSVRRQADSHAARLAAVIEQAREDRARGQTPTASAGHAFVEALAAMIRDAMRPEAGDPVFQAMALRHRHAPVREYASLSAHAARDRRQVRAAVNALAHPARLESVQAGPQREALARLHAAASSQSWRELDEALRSLEARQHADGTPFAHSLARLLESAALLRLERLAALERDDRVHRYQALRDLRGPRSGSSAAAEQGYASQQRGRAVEAQAAQALGALARRLDEQAGGAGVFRVATSLLVSPAIAGSAARAKTEWDAVLLRRAHADGEGPVWDVCLLVEAKASIDAATTDLPRLLRGLRLLAQAGADAIYPFESREGRVCLRGASLRKLSADEPVLARSVLYCCDASAEPPRLLGAASRMQLLSAPASLAFADALENGGQTDLRMLEPVWHALLESPQWGAVLHQYPMLRQARELAVHIDDLKAAIARVAETGHGSC